MALLILVDRTLGLNPLCGYEVHPGHSLAGVWLFPLLSICDCMKLREHDYEMLVGDLVSSYDEDMAGMDDWEAVGDGTAYVA